MKGLGDFPRAPRRDGDHLNRKAIDMTAADGKDDRKNGIVDPFGDMWSDFDRFFATDFEEMNRRVDRMFSQLRDAPGVKTYGYTMYQGPDGVPHIQEFGNTRGDSGLLAGSPAETIAEPLTDVQQDGDVVRATAEIPGVAKEDIVLDGTPSSLTISVDTPRRKFSKTLAMPCDVDVSSAKAEYNNGILEVTMKALKPAETKTRISIQRDPERPPARTSAGGRAGADTYPSAPANFIPNL